MNKIDMVLKELDDRKKKSIIFFFILGIEYAEKIIKKYFKEEV